MITCSADLQSAYEWMYSCMRNYIWDLDVVEILADVEVDTFDAFVDYEKAERDFSKLYPELKEVADENEDGDLLRSADAFKKLLTDANNSESPAVLKIVRVDETVNNPEFEDERIRERLEEYSGEIDEEEESSENEEEESFESEEEEEI